MRYWLVVLLFVVAIIALHLLSHGEAVLLSRPLATLPMILGVWHGHDTPIEPRIVTAMGVDDYLNRIYENNSGEELGIYIGYYKSQRAGATIHSPKNCLPGAGWQPFKSGYTELAQPDGRQVSVNLYEIQKGTDHQVVLYWYQSHGRIVASEYRAKIYMVSDAIRLNRTDAALVRVVTRIGQDRNKAHQRAVAFAEQTLVQLKNILQ
jgi:EpsI family protein